MNHRREFRPERADAIAEMQRRAHQCVQAIDKQLASGGHDYILGDEFTAADIMLGYSMYLVDRLAPLPLGSYKHAVQYWARLQTRPAWIDSIADVSPPPGKL
eukprot:SAG31_NODE_4888_length_2884_cov_1.624776_3_plen_102_part_00